MSTAGQSQQGPPADVSTWSLQKPVMGDLMQVDADGKQVPIVGGGTPMHDCWSGPDPNHLEALLPDQQRPIYGVQKAKAYCVTGLQLKLSPQANLM